MDILLMSFLIRIGRSTDISIFYSNTNINNCYRSACHLLFDEILFNQNKNKYEKLEDLENLIKNIPINKKDEYCFTIKDKTKASKFLIKRCEEIANSNSISRLTDVRM